MHRRFLFPLAAGIVGLVAISPALAASPSPSGAKGTPAKATTTSSGKGATSSTTAGSRPGTGSQTGSTTDTSGGGTGSTDTTDTTDTTGSTDTTDTSGATGTTATTGPGGRGGSTATTSPASGTGGGTGSSSSTCGAPVTDQGPAPQMGEAPQTHGAGDAGSVDVERLSPTELRIAKATANSGWVEQVTAPSGPRVTVKFQRSGQSPTLIRFAASMDQAGRIIHTRVTSCG